MKLILRHTGYLLLAWMLGILAWGMTSCSDETYPDVNPPEGGTEEALVKRYFSMRLYSAENENIDLGDNDFDFGNGSETEHLMDVSGKSQNVVIFINDDYTYYGYATVDYDRLYSQGTSDGNGSEIAYIGVIHSPDPDVIFNLPTKGLLVLNAYNITDALDEFSLRPAVTIEDVLKLTDDSAGPRRPGQSGVYHTMTSTAYLADEDGQWKHSILFEIDKRRIYETRMQAVLSPAAIAAVERMTSKFSITLPGADAGTALNFTPDGGRAQVIVCHYTDGQPNYNNRNWTCSVEGWGINKYETSSYYFRNIVGEGASTASYPYTYGSDINTTGKPFYNGWNRPNERRSLWGKDPHYDDGLYPRQYRPAVDNTELPYYGSEGKASLGYISYNELSKDFSALGTPQGVSLYSNENTLSDHRIGGLWQHDIGATELLLGARIHIDRVSETKEDYDLFRNRIGVFYPSVTDFATYFIQTFNQQMASQTTMTYRYYDWENPKANSGGNVMKTLNIPANNYKLYYGNEPLTPEKMASIAKYLIPATIENGDGKVIPWIPGMYIGRRVINPDTYEEEGEVIRLNIETNDFKSLIYDWIGSFDHFNQGRMVYAVPVLHRATVDKVSDVTYRPAVGDFGVARNTWYSFSIQQINSLGAPVDDLDQKIIVYQSSLENSIMMEMKVLDWHEFSTEVTLPDKL